LPYIKDKRLIALAVASPERVPELPDVPTFKELGLEPVNRPALYGIWAPKGTPVEAQTHAVDEIRKACQSDEAKAVWANQGAEFPNLTGAQFDSFIKAELRKWSQVVKASGAKLD
jgi:tripartite-type tricarboxylate transporter receptor subunit TctC